MKKCEYCKHSVYGGDPSVGISMGWECHHPNITDEDIELQVKQEDYAERCKYYDPVIAFECQWCHKRLGIPLHDIKFWAETLMGSLTACSEECKESIESASQKLEREELESLQGKE